MKYKILCVLLLVGFSFNAQATELSFDPSVQNVGVNGSTTVDLVISDLGDDILTAYDLSIFFDDTILQFDGFEFGSDCFGFSCLDVLGFDANIEEVIDWGFGEIEVAELSLDFDEDLELLQPDEFVLGTFTFTGLQGGLSALNISVNELVGAAATELDVTIMSGSIEVLGAVLHCISDFTWFDGDRDGLYDGINGFPDDGTDIAIPDVTVTLRNDLDEAIAMSTSGTDGSFQFCSLVGDDPETPDVETERYVIEITDSGGVLTSLTGTTQASIDGEQEVVVEDMDVIGVNFGYHVPDSDMDGVLDDDDVCPNTMIPDGAPSGRLGKNRWTFVGNDGTNFMQAAPQSGSLFQFTTTSTGGCSCEQIVAETGAGKGHLRKGCSTSLMLNWVGSL